MAVTRVQSGRGSGLALSVPVNLSQAPANGNLIIFWVCTNAPGVTAPTGLTQLDTIGTGFHEVIVYYKIAGASEPTSYTFSTTGTSNAYWGITMVEVAGQAATNYINQHVITQTTGTTLTAGPATPSVLNCYSVASFSNANTINYTNLTTGWTMLQSPASAAYIDNFLAEGPTTTDTSTALSPSLTWDSSVTGTASIILIAPDTMSASRTSVVFSAPSAAAQTVTLSGGISPYSIQTAPNSSIATASLASSTLTITPVNTGTTSVTVKDSSAATATISITVDAPASGGGGGNIVQSAFGSGSGGTITLVLSGAPTPGNLLVVMGVYNSMSVNPMATGWTTIDFDNTTSGPVDAVTAYRVVQAGDSANVVPFNNMGAGGTTVAGVWEISGQAVSSFIDKHEMNESPISGAGVYATVTATSMTPSTSSSLGLWMAASYDASGDPTTTPAGYTEDNNTLQEKFVHQLNLTQGTGYSPTFTWAAGTQNVYAMAMGVVIALQPAGGNAPVVQQSTSGSVHAANLTLTLSKAPTVGNLLVLSANVYPVGSTVAAPPGFTALDTSNTTIMQTYYRIVQTGDGTSYTLTPQGSPYIAATMWEISNFNTSSPFNGHAVSAGGTGTTATTPSLTPSVSQCLPLVSFSNGTTATYSGLTAGYSVDQTTPVTNFASVSAHGPSTSTSAVSASLTWGTSATWDSMLVLVAPPSSSLTISPTSISVPYNAGSQSVTVSRGGYVGAISATSSDTTIAKIDGGGNGPTQTFQVLRQNDTGGSCTINFTCADGVSGSLVFTVYGPLVVTSTSATFQPTGTISVSEAMFRGTITCTILGTALCTVSPTSQSATGATPIAFTFTPNNVGYGTQVVQFSDGTNTTSEVVLITGPLVVSPSTLTLNVSGGSGTITATEAADPSSIVASSSNTAVATVSTTTNSPGNSTITVNPVSAGTCTITVSDQHGGTSTVSVTVTGFLTASASTLTFVDPASANQTFTVSGGISPYTPSSSNTSVATVSIVGSTVTVHPVGSGSCTVTVQDSESPVASTTVSVTVGTALSVSASSVSVPVGTTNTSISALNGNPPYTSSSSNTGIATTSVSGSTINITGVAAGSATITVHDADGETAPITTTVLGSISASPTSLTFATQASASQNVTISGGTTPLLVAVSAPTVATATVSSTTVTVTPHAPGTCNVIVTDSANRSVTIPVTVNTTSTNSYTINFTSPFDDPKQLTFVGGTGLTWTMTDYTIASLTVNGTVGILKPLKPGSTQIKVLDSAGDQVVLTVNVASVTSTLPAWTDLQTIQKVKFFDPANTSNSWTATLNPTQQVIKPGNVRKYSATTNGTSVIQGDREYPPKEISLTWNCMDSADYEAFRLMQYLNPVVYIDNNDQGYLGVLLIDSTEQIPSVTKKVYRVMASFLVLAPYNGQTILLNQLAAPTLSLVTSVSTTGGYITGGSTLYLWTTATSPWGESVVSTAFAVSIPSGTNTNWFAVQFTPPSSTWYRKTRIYWNTSNNSLTSTLLTECLSGQGAAFSVYTNYVAYSTLNPPTYGTAFTGRWDGGKWTQTT